MYRPHYYYFTTLLLWSSWHVDSNVACIKNSTQPQEIQQHQFEYTKGNEDLGFSIRGLKRCSGTTPSATPTVGTYKNPLLQYKYSKGASARDTGRGGAVGGVKPPGAGAGARRRARGGGGRGRAN